MNDCDEYTWASLITVRRLKALRLRASFEIRDCEQSLDRAHVIIELLHSEVQQHGIKLGLGFVLAALVTFGENILKRVLKKISLRNYDHHTFITSKLK